jgi:hypothetical protein
MLLGLTDFVINPAHNALRVDQKTATPVYQTQKMRDLPSLAQHPAGVRKQAIAQAASLAKTPVALGVLSRTAQHIATQGLKVVEGVVESASLTDAYRGIVSRIEKEQQPTASIPVQAMRPTLFVQAFEIRRGIPGTQARIKSPKAHNPKA